MQGNYTRTLYLLALSCFCALSIAKAQISSVSGIVYVDHNGDGAMDGPDYPHPVVTVLAFEDDNNNGAFDAGEALLGSSITNEHGQYAIQGILVTQPEFTVTLDPNDLVAGANIVQGGVVLAPGHHIDIYLGFQGENAVCYAVADEGSPTGNDHLVVINRISGTNRWVGASGAGWDVYNIEAISFNIGASELLAIDGDHLGSLDIYTGVFTRRPNKLGTANHPVHGPRPLDDADGMSFDPFTGELYASERDEPVGADALFKIDPQTGSFIPDAFGPGIDYVLIDGPGFLEDIDDIAISPIDGQMYGINNNNGQADVLVKIDKKTGVGEIIGTITWQGANLNDVEGFGFTNTGLLGATTGAVGNPANSLFFVDLNTAEATLSGAFTNGADFEGCDCLTQRPNELSGTVFYDADKDGLQDTSPGSSEYGISGQQLFIFLDTDSDGVLSAGDVQVHSIYTDGNGDYSYITASNQDFVISIDSEPFPILHELTTDAEQFAGFGGGFGGMTDPDNDFGLGLDFLLPVELGELSVELLRFDGVLRWNTVHEINSDVFIVERSMDGMLFEAVGRVKSYGTTQRPQDYKYVDAGIAKVDVPVVYYRIKQLDFDGTHEYTQVVELIPVINAPLTLQAYPNPVSDGSFRVEYATAGQEKGYSMELNVVNAMGQHVYRKTLENGSGVNALAVSTAQWVPGIYHLYLTRGQDMTSYKLTVR